MSLGYECLPGSNEVKPAQSGSLPPCHYYFADPSKRTEDHPKLSPCPAPQTIKPGFPLSLPILTKLSCFMMTSIILTCAYIKCNDGSFDCQKKFPDISHVMGHEPLNKLYAMMLTIYALNKLQYIRAYYLRLQGVFSHGTNEMLLIFGYMSCVFGPCIGYWDVYYEVHIHSAVTAVFVVGELGYVITMLWALNKRRSHWTSKSVQRNIDYLIYS